MASCLLRLNAAGVSVVFTALFAFTCSGGGGNGSLNCVSTATGIDCQPPVEDPGDANPQSSDSDATAQDERDLAPLHALMQAVPEALCDYYIACGDMDPAEKAECVADIEDELADDIDPDCAALLDFYMENKEAIDACMEGKSGTCEGDDLDSFCPILGQFDMAQCERATTPNDGNAGAYCDSAAECKTEGALCLESVVGGKQHFCAIPCSTLDDCSPMHTSKTNGGMALPAKVAGDNHWNSPTLFRGIVCDKPPNGGAPGQKYCQYICNEWSAVVLDEGGGASGCACWPNYRWTNEATKDECVWDTSVECSIFKKCVPSQDPDPECSGELSCTVNEMLEGVCIDYKTGAQMEACVRQCMADSCDSWCLASCQGEACADICCDFTCE
ncbi:MAG: hypothetical protein FJ109_08320 [Deltaproteobacteria bacterium]|nr:hypothetical protein [Deltaproteobacteria bacterium]